MKRMATGSPVQRTARERRPSQYPGLDRLVLDAMSQQRLRIDDVRDRSGISRPTILKIRQGLYARDSETRAVLRALGIDTAVLDDLPRSADATPDRPTSTVRARTVTEELVTLLGLPDDVLEGLAPEDHAQMIAEASLTIIRVARERRGRTT